MESESALPIARRKLIFLTTNGDKHAEIATLLSREAGVEVERRTATLPPPPSIIPEEVARFRAVEAFRVLGSALFAEALAVELPDGLVSGASFRQAFEQPGGSSWLKKHQGVEGVARICVGFTTDGVVSQVFETAIPGQLQGMPRGRGNAAWERFWVPKGGTRTLADLTGSAQADPFQNAPYLALAKSLRTK